MRQTAHFEVTGEQKIHCADCEQRIDNVLRKLPGIAHVQASFQTQQVVVTFDPAKAGPEQVRSKLEQLGYQLTRQEGRE